MDKMEHYQALVKESSHHKLPKTNVGDLFCFDREKIIGNNDPFFWFLREDGTHLIFLSEDNVERYVYDLYRFFGRQLVAFFWNGKSLLKMDDYNQVIRTYRNYVK